MAAWEALFDASKALPSPISQEQALTDWLTAELEATGARVRRDPAGSLRADRGTGGVVIFLATDEPTFVLSGAGPDGRDLIPLGTPLGAAQLAGHGVCSQAGGGLLRARGDDLELDAFSDSAPAVGTPYVFATARTRQGGALSGPSVARRAVLAAAMAAVLELDRFTLVAAGRTALNPAAGTGLLRGLAGRQGVALETANDEDGRESGRGPLIIRSARGFAAPPGQPHPAGARPIVDPGLATLAAQLLRAGVRTASLGIAARNFGGDSEKIVCEDISGLLQSLRLELQRGQGDA